MASIRKRGGQIQVHLDVYADVDLGEVLDEISTEDLKAELEARERPRSYSADGPSGGRDLNLRLLSWEADKLRDAVRTDDGRRAIDLLKEYLA